MIENHIKLIINRITCLNDNTIFLLIKEWDSCNTFGLNTDRKSKMADVKMCNNL